MIFKFTTTHPGAGLTGVVLTDVVVDTDNVLSVESNADGGTIVLGDGIMYQCLRVAALELQELLMREDVVLTKDIPMERTDK